MAAVPEPIPFTAAVVVCRTELFVVFHRPGSGCECPLLLSSITAAEVLGLRGRPCDSCWPHGVVIVSAHVRESVMSAVFARLRSAFRPTPAVPAAVASEPAAPVAVEWPLAVVNDRYPDRTEFGTRSRKPGFAPTRRVWV